MRWLTALIALALMLALAACAAPAPPTAVPATTAPAPTAAPPTAAPTTVPTVASTTTTGATTSRPPATTAASMTASPAAATFPMTITDATGRKVTLARPPMRIASVAPSNTEILYALGLGDRVVAVDELSNFPPEAKAKATAGSYLKPNLEGLVAAQPDLVLATASHRESLVPALEERTIPTVMLEPKSLPEVFDTIEQVGRMTGRTEAATALVSRLRQRTDAVTARVASQPRPRTYLELSPQLHSAGPGTFLNDLLERAGGANIAATSTTAWPQLNQEALILADPQVILLSYGPDGETPEQVRARPSWGSLSAVRDGKVILIDPDLTSRPGPRIVDGLEAMAAALHGTAATLTPKP